MYGLNAVALVFFGCINVVAYQLYKCPEGRRRTVVRWLCAVLLSGNLLRYGVIYPFVKGVVMLSVEFSTVAYFLVPAILLTSKRRLRSWGRVFRADGWLFLLPGDDRGGRRDLRRVCPA